MGSHGQPGRGRYAGRAGRVVPGVPPRSGCRAQRQRRCRRPCASMWPASTPSGSLCPASRPAGPRRDPAQPASPSLSRPAIRRANCERRFMPGVDARHPSPARSARRRPTSSSGGRTGLVECDHARRGLRVFPRAVPHVSVRNRGREPQVVELSGSSLVGRVEWSTRRLRLGPGAVRPGSGPRWVQTWLLRDRSAGSLRVKVKGRARR